MTKEVMQGRERNDCCVNNSKPKGILEIGEIDISAVHKRNLAFAYETEINQRDRWN